MSQTHTIKALCDQLAAELKDKFSEFEGFKLRIDAGEPGLIYLALRDAKKEVAAGERLSEALEAFVAKELNALQPPVEFAIGLGFSNRDLILQIELRQK